MQPDQITAIVPTRGNVDLDDILASLDCFGEVIVWDNSVRDDLGVYGRYAAIHEARFDHIYTQDDDCLVPRACDLALIYGGTPLCSMSRNRWDDYPDSVLLGWGSIFPRTAPWEPFARYGLHHQDTPLATFLRTCDVVFSAQTDWKRVDFGHDDLPWATANDRMCVQPVHYPERRMVLERCRALRDSAQVAA